MIQATGDSVMKLSAQKVRKHQDSSTNKFSVYISITGLCLAVFIASLDSSIANVALPNISHELNISSSKAIWIVNIYQLVMLSLILPIAALADQIGYKKIFVLGLIFFTLASYLCGNVDSFNTLLWARAMQGLGAAAILGTNLALVRLVYPAKHLGLGLGINAFVIAIGLAGGPIVASLILTTLNWNWLFLINIPIGVLAYILTIKLPKQAVKSVQPYNYYSAFLCIIMFACLIYALGGLTLSLSISLIIILFILSLFSGLKLFFRDSKSQFPIFPFDLFSNPIFSLSVITALTAFITQGLAFVALPFIFQNAGFTQTEIGWLIAPWACMGAITAPLAGTLAKKISAAVLGLIGLVLLGSGILLLTLYLDHLSFYFIVFSMLVCGLGFGLFLTPNQQMAISHSPLNKSGTAGGMLNVARTLGQAIGATLVALFFSFGWMDSVLWLGVCCAFIAACFSFLRIIKK